MFTVALDLCDAMDRDDKGREPAPTPDRSLEEEGREVESTARWWLLSDRTRGWIEWVGCERGNKNVGVRGMRGWVGRVARERVLRWRWLDGA